jgi:HEAT repeat protein
MDDRLADPDAWPEAVRALVAEGDPDALPALVRAYDRPVEGGKLVLLEAMEALGGRERAADLGESADPEERAVAARLMHLLPDERHVAALERLAADSEPDVAARARRAIEHQPRTPEWHAAMARLPGS